MSGCCPGAKLDIYFCPVKSSFISYIDYVPTDLFFDNLIIDNILKIKQLEDISQVKNAKIKQSYKYMNPHPDPTPPTVNFCCAKWSY